MLNNAYFLEKTVKDRPFDSGGWGLSPQNSALWLLPTITALSSSFLALNAFCNLQKKNKITTVNDLFLLLPHFFTYFSLQTLYFLLTGGGKNISCPKAQDTLVTPLILIITMQWRNVAMHHLKLANCIAYLSQFDLINFQCWKGCIFSLGVDHKCNIK